MLLDYASWLIFNMYFAASAVAGDTFLYLEETTEVENKHFSQNICLADKQHIMQYCYGSCISIYAGYMSTQQDDKQQNVKRKGW